MKNDTILKNYISNITKTKIEKKLLDQVLIESQIPKGNKVLVVETSVLFIDIRGSTKLSKKVGQLNMTKIYKIFGVIASMAVREFNGMIFQFSGDGFMAAFNSSDQSNFRLNAFNSVIRFKELLDTIYKSNVSSDWHFDCGYSISTGHILMTRLKSKKFKLHSFGVFPGDATNLSSKLSELADKDELLVDHKTYEHLKRYQEFEKRNSKDLDVEYYVCKVEI